MVFEEDKSCLLNTDMVLWVLLAITVFPLRPVDAVSNGFAGLLHAVAENAAARLSGITEILLNPQEENDGKIENILTEGNHTIAMLIKQLSRMGTNAIIAANKKGALIKRQCVSDKCNTANEFLSIKREELKTCNYSTASIVADFAQSFIKSNDPTAPFLGNPIPGCTSGLPKCKPDPFAITANKEYYETWGTRVSAVQRCVQNIVSQTAVEFTKIFKNLRSDCFPQKATYKSLSTNSIVIPKPPALGKNNY